MISSMISSGMNSKITEGDAMVVEVKMMVLVKCVEEKLCRVCNQVVVRLSRAVIRNVGKWRSETSTKYLRSGIILVPMRSSGVSGGIRRRR